VDIEMVSSARAPADVDEFYREHAVGLIRLAMLMVGDGPTAEDVVQDAFLGLHDRWRSLRDPTAALTYLRSAVLNRCRSVLRRRSVRRHRLRFAAPLAAAAGVTAVVFLAVGLPHRAHDATAPRGTGPLMAPRPSGDAQVAIYLCSRISANPSCHRQDATREQQDAIDAALKKMPEVRRIESITSAEAYAEARRQFAGTKIGGAIRPGDIPTSFRVTLRRPADAQVVLKALSGRPGVDQVVTG
jgi:RNA polymerase sigma factor (sigma-70 family)